MLVYKGFFPKVPACGWESGFWALPGDDCAVNQEQVAQAKRFSAPSWSDLRLWLGLLLVAGSVVVGSALLKRADDSVAVWAVNRDVAVGETLVAEDLVAHRIRFVDAADRAPYFLADEQLPSDLTVTASLAKGQLLPRSVVGAATDLPATQLPLEVASNQVPPGVHAGSIIDVWIAGERGNPAELVFAGVPVISVSSTDTEFDAGGPRQIVIGISDGESAIGRALELAEAGTITIVVKG